MAHVITVCGFHVIVCFNLIYAMCDMGWLTVLSSVSVEEKLKLNRSTSPDGKYRWKTGVHMLVEVKHVVNATQEKTSQDVASYQFRKKGTSTIIN